MCMCLGGQFLSHRGVASADQCGGRRRAFLQLQCSCGWPERHCPYHVILYIHTYTYTHTHRHITVFFDSTSFFASLLLFCSHHTSHSSLHIITTENSPLGEKLCIRALSHQVWLIKSFLNRAVRVGTFKYLASGFGPGKKANLPLVPCLLPDPSSLPKFQKPNK